MNPTLFYNNNPSLKHPAWDADSHFKYLAQKKVFKTKRSYERWVEKGNFLPDNIDLENYTKTLSESINSLIQNYFIQEYEKQRKLILFIQFFESKNNKFIFANDRRKGRLWVKVKSNQMKDIYEGIKYLSKLRKKNIVLFPHQELLQKFQDYKFPTTKSNYQLEFPNHIFQATEVDPTKTTFTKSFSLKQNSYLSDLEAESIHIIREVVSETKNPVMLYSVGKDSSVMLHLAQKAFYPSPPPFPLMHVDTRWKFREMYLFRNWMAQKSNMKLITHINPEGVKSNINPFDHGSSVHTDIMKTQGLKQALDQYQFDAAFGVLVEMRKSLVPKREFFLFEQLLISGIPKIKDQNFGNFITLKSINLRVYGYFPSLIGLY